MKEIPKVKKISKDEQIDILKKELERKDKIIEKLREEKELLFKLSIKNTDKLIQSSSKKID